MKRRVLIAKKRGRLAGALIGGVLLGPLGALAGAALNSKTDYYEDVTPEEEQGQQAVKAKAYEASKMTASQWKRVGWTYAVLIGIVGLIWYATLPPAPASTAPLTLSDIRPSQSQ